MQPHLVAIELSERRAPGSSDLVTQLANVDRRIVEQEAELDRCLGLYLRGTVPVEHLDAAAKKIRGSLAALRAYRTGLIEEQRRSERWELEMVGVIEALAALQAKLNIGLPFDERRMITKMLVKEILIETPSDSDGKPYSVAHITYRFERPTSETPLPIELAPLFAWRHIDESRDLL